MTKKRLLLTVLILLSMLCCLFINAQGSDTIIGDVNGDGSFNSIDFGQFRLFLLGSSLPNPSAGDVNGDGDVNSIDFGYMRQHLLGIIKDFPVKPTQTPVSTAIISTETYEAEEASITNGILETTNTGYSGSGYVNYNNEVGSYVEWKVNAPVSGSYKLILRYSNGTTINRPMSITVNGNTIINSMDFNSTGAWTVWTEEYIVANLNQGQNVIRATGTSSNGGPNVDYL